jgi:hypothetical protein
MEVAHSVAATAGDTEVFLLIKFKILMQLLIGVEDSDVLS